MFGVYHGISFFSDTPPVRYKTSSESQSQCRGAIPRASFENPSQRPWKILHEWPKWWNPLKHVNSWGSIWWNQHSTQVFCRFNSENYLPDPFYFWGSKLLNRNGSTSRPRLGLFWYSSSKYWGCPILPRTQMIKCLISRRYMYLSPNTSRLPSPPIPCGHDTTLTAPPCPASLGPRCQAVDAVPAFKWEAAWRLLLHPKCWRSTGGLS